MSYGRFKLRRDTASAWTTANPVLAAGEIALETDTVPYRLKIGDGSTAWASLAYWGTVTSTSITDATTVGRAVLTAASAAAARSALGAGDVTGPSSTTDNTLVRMDGTTGKVIQDSPVVVDDTGAISNYRAKINKQTGTAYTLVLADSGKIVELSNAAAIALACDPALPEGFACTVVQSGGGVVTFAPSGAGTVVNRQAHTKTAGTNAICMLYVRSNSGSNAVFVLGGDTAA